VAQPAHTAGRVTVAQIIGRRPPTAAFRDKAAALMRLCPSERYPALVALSPPEWRAMKPLLRGQSVGSTPPGLWPGACAADVWFAVKSGALTPHHGPGGVNFDANEVRALAAAHPKRRPRT